MHKQHKIYMANVSPNTRRPNATYIPLTCVGLAVGGMQILEFALGVTQILAFLDTYMLVLLV